MEIYKNYEMFKMHLEDMLWKHVRVIRNSQYANATHHTKMFLAMPKDQAHRLLNSAEYHEEFHPDAVEFFRKRINE